MVFVLNNLVSLKAFSFEKKSLSQFRCHVTPSSSFCLFESEPNNESKKLSLVCFRLLLSFRGNMLLMTILSVSGCSMLDCVLKFVADLSTTTLWVFDSGFVWLKLWASTEQQELWVSTGECPRNQCAGVSLPTALSLLDPNASEQPVTTTRLYRNYDDVTKH